MAYLEIVNVKGREILDSRGNPTVEAEVTLADGEGHQARLRQRDFDQAESDRLGFRDAGSHQDGAQGGLCRDFITPQRRDGGYHHRRSGRGAQHLPN